MKQYHWLKMVLLFSVIAVVGFSVPFTLSVLFDSTVTLHNTFIPPEGLDEETAVQIIVDKDVLNLGSEKITPEGFVFILENAETGDRQTVATDANGYAAFELPYTGLDAGKTYRYTLYEQNDRRPGVTYSTLVYTVDVSLDMLDGKPVATVLLNGEVTDDRTAKFENIYQVKETPETGDASQLMLLVCLTLASAGAVLVLMKKLRMR